jgi:polysaccharide deacetylase 2 family uncharacterized protein YibQ
VPDSKNALNDQISDSIAQINALLLDSEGSNVRAMTYQVMAHTIAMSMYNTVYQQQQMYVLQNATTTAAITEALKSNPAEAVKIAQAAIIGSDLTKTISQLKTLMDELNVTYSDIKSSVSKPKVAPAAKPKPKQK